MKKWKTILLLIIMVVTFIPTGCALQSKDSTEEERSISELNLVKAERGTLAISISASANVTLPHQSRLSFGTSGTIESLYVVFGDVVQEGQVLAELNTAPLERSLARAKSSLRSAEIDLDNTIHPTETAIAQAQSAVASAAAALNSAEDELNSIQNPSETDIAQAKSAVVSATAALNSAKDEIEKTETPYSEADIATARGAVRNAQTALDNAQRDMDNAKLNASLNITSAENAVSQQETLYSQRIMDFLGEKITLDDLEQQKEVLEQARSQLEIARNTADKSIATTENAVARAQDTLLSAKENLDDILSGADSTLIALKQANAESARVALLQARENLEDILAGGNPIALDLAQARVNSAKSTLLQAQDTLNDLLAGGNPDIVELKQIQVNNAQISVDEGTEQLEKAVLLAPFDGVIDSVNVTEGDNISANSIIMHLVDTSEVEVEGLIDEVDIIKAQVGQKANITLDSLPGMSLAGKVKAISPIANNQSGVVSYRTAITIDTMPPGPLQLREGLTAVVD
ncbi:MAG: HlyD family efflux transporter periplasmic adaptor subunit, partial [Dehalococcoidia bacterium]|nr:HlyD family efflux transporter periplasmic adaptor subunit [Dehalococcoidia bacterium]